MERSNTCYACVAQGISVSVCCFDEVANGHTLILSLCRQVAFSKPEKEEVFL